MPSSLNLLKKGIMNDKVSREISHISTQITQLHPRLILWPPSELITGNPKTHEIQLRKMERVMGIEPNEHRIPRFLGKYGYHTDRSENHERPNSSNVLPMSRVMLGCGTVGGTLNFEG